MIFERKYYLTQLIHGIGNGMVKIVTGIRRCGKSFLLFNIFRDYLLQNGVTEDHIIGLSLDDFRNSKLRNPQNLLDYIDAHYHNDGKTNYIILDEIQLAERFVEVLLSLMHMPNVEVYVSGSNSKFLSSDVVTEFRGRGDEIRVYPLTMSELLEGIDMEFQPALQLYFRYGGLPQAVLQANEHKREDFLRNMFETTYLRDVIERNHLRNQQGMRELLLVLASNIGCTTNPSKIAKTFKSASKIDLSENTIRQYITHLQDAFIIREAQRYNIKGRKYIGADSKYFFADMGIRNVALNFRQIEAPHIMENVIYNELIARGYLVDVGMVETWKDNGERDNERKTYEVDFVVNNGSQRYYIQSAYAMPTPEKVQQELRSLVNIDDSFKKIVVVYEDILPHRNNNGVLTLGLKQFLLDTQSIEL
jgi:predicted AAA+ superfamily ATPase